MHCETNNARISANIRSRNKKLNKKPGLWPSSSKANIEFINCDDLRSPKGGNLASCSR